MGRGVVYTCLLRKLLQPRFFHDLIFPNADVQKLPGNVSYYRVRDKKTVTLASCISKFDARSDEV